MAIVTCGPDGSTVEEVMTQINLNTVAIGNNYDKVTPSAQNDLVVFGPNNTLLDSQISIVAVQLVGEPVA